MHNEDDLKGSTELHLTDEEDSDCNHATLLEPRDRWLLALGFKYSKGLAGHHVGVARQFVQAAVYRQSTGLSQALVDDLFSAAEQERIRWRSRCRRRMLLLLARRCR